MLLLAIAVVIGGPLVWLLTPPLPEAAPPPPPAPLVARAPAAEAPGPRAAPATPTEASPVRPPAAAQPAPAAPPAIPRARDPDGDLTPDLSDYVNLGETPTMAEVIARLRAAGVTGGLAAFSPPGTRPPKVGLGVPENFELPPGYVRHYQATDDGQRIEPILMFSPDYQWYDAAGQPIALPADRVVPPELAPPGLPLRRITIPAPLEPGK